MAVANVLLVAGSANFSTRDVWDGYRLALEGAGLRVVPYPTFSYLQVLSAESVCNDIIGTAVDVEQQFNWVLFVDGLYFRGKRARVPLSIRRAGIPTALIATDDPYEEIPNVEALYTVRLTNELRSAREGVIYLPTATLPLPEVPRVVRPKYDVSFLGTVFEDRLPLLLRIAEHCEQTGRRFLVAGKLVAGREPLGKFTCTELRSRTIEAVEKWEIYTQSRVTLNLFRASERPADSPSPRVFEVTAFGQAALLTGPRRSEVTRLWGDSVYHFDDEASALAALEAALTNDDERLRRVAQAQQVTLDGHLYEHRAAELIDSLQQAAVQQSDSGAAEHRVAWIIGCGRTGSTWLAEMLGDLPHIRRWHEPYFGRFLRHVHERPDDLDRQSAFFFRRHQPVWLKGLRELFFAMVRDRYPQFGRHALVVKEVNTPEFYEWVRPLFPSSRMILLVRDPFDVLDSYLDLQKPGSWNQRFGDSADPLSDTNVRRTAEHIRATTTLALAAYDAFPIEQRLRLSYEELLRDPVPGLLAAARLVDVEIDPEGARQAAEARAFSKHAQTGTLQFRRRGQAEGWRTSGNFSDPVLAIAREVLGPLRSRLGYPDAPAASAAPASAATAESAG